MGDIRWPDGKKCAVMFTFDVAEYMGQRDAGADGPW